MSRLAQNSARLLELQRQPDAGRRGQLGGLAQRGGGPRVIVGDAVAVKSAATIRVGTFSSWSKLEPAAEVVPVRLRSSPRGEQQSPLRGRRDRVEPLPSSRRRASATECDSRNVSSFVSQSSTAVQPPRA